MKWRLLPLLCTVVSGSRSLNSNHLRTRTLTKDTAQDIELKDATNENVSTESTVDQSGGEQSSSTAQRGRVDLVHLVPFDVQLVVTQDEGITTHELTDIVTVWMNKAYEDQLQSFGLTEQNLYAEFDGVVLYENDNTRKLDEGNHPRDLQGLGEVYTAKFKGGAVFSRDEVRIKTVPPNDVLLIQQLILQNDTTIAALLPLLQESDILGLGSAVVDVNAYPAPETSGGAESKDKKIDIVIIVAIVVACAAFFFLLAAVFWAYHYDRKNRRAYLVKEHTSKPSHQDRTDSETGADDSPEKIHPGHAYPAVIGGDDMKADTNYPESVISDSLIDGSVISEDISTSLSQYYKSGMGRAGITNSDYARSNSGMLNDAGSVSSMESYGYSLDEGMSTPMPSEAPYKKDRERIGGLPVEPDLGDDVQIPDLDKELADLDIKLTPNMEHVDLDVETYSEQDLENYRSESEEDMYSNLSNKDSSASYEGSKIQDPPPQRTISVPLPVDVDSVVVDGNDDENSPLDENERLRS